MKQDKKNGEEEKPFSDEITANPTEDWTEGKTVGEEAQCEQEQETFSVTDLEVEALNRQATEYKNKYLQLLADSQNAQRRLQKDRQEISQYAVKSILLEILHPLDHLENALNYADQASDEVKHWATGFHMILSQFLDVLANHNVKPIDAIGQEFDPHLHEAIEMVATDEMEPGLIVEENIKGYLIGEKTLRPSRVKVAKKPGEEKEQQNEGENS